MVKVLSLLLSDWTGQLTLAILVLMIAFIGYLMYLLTHIKPTSRQP